MNSPAASTSACLLMGVLEELGGDASDGNVVYVYILLADKVEQEIERAIIDEADGDGEGRLGGLFGRGLPGGFAGL